MSTHPHPRIGHWRRYGLVFLLTLLAADPVAAQGVAQLTDFKSARQGLGVMDDAGTAVFINSSTDQLGGNGEHVFQIFKFDAATGAGEQLTDFEVGVTGWHFGLSVSDDGQWIAFLSSGDLTGQNPDASRELFVMAADGTQITQLTNDTSVLAGSVSFFEMTDDGNSVVFVSTSDLTGENPSGTHQIFKVDRDASGLAQITSGADLGYIWGFDVSDDGQRIVFGSQGDPTGGNPDGTRELFAVNGDGSG